MEPETLKPQEKTQNNKIEEKKDDSSVEVAGEDLERAIEVFGNLPKDQQTILSRGILQFNSPIVVLCHPQENLENIRR